LTPAALCDLIYHTDICLRFPLREASLRARGASAGAMPRSELPRAEQRCLVGQVRGALRGWLGETRGGTSRGKQLLEASTEMLSPLQQLTRTWSRASTATFCCTGPSRGSPWANRRV